MKSKKIGVGRKQTTLGDQCCSANLNSLNYIKVLIFGSLILWYTWRASLLAFPYPWLNSLLETNQCPVIIGCGRNDWNTKSEKAPAHSRASQWLSGLLCARAAEKTRTTREWKSLVHLGKLCELGQHNKLTEWSLGTVIPMKFICGLTYGLSWTMSQCTWK